MAHSIPIYDPYRKRQTTIAQFARDEGTQKASVYCYYKRHGTLDGYRQRPPHGGPQARIFTLKGKYIKVTEAARLLNVSIDTLRTYRRHGGSEFEVSRIRPSDLIFQSGVQAQRYPLEDGTLVTITEYAAMHGIPRNPVAMYVRNHGGLIGYENRGPSRVRPNLYPHTGMGVSKTRKQWAAFFGVALVTIKVWLRTHNRTMDGFEKRRTSSAHQAHEPL